ncbi:family 16 glycoside hydrolase [Roseiconus lacunae]|uniref:family 16 glycoside hydrolase n=1 Tax=Roseiconus lacunae TaxID=2605694 RepID=UPI003084A081|nr:family 16 glycoside hydrolase [Stieleria sp. HD01]
MQLQSSIVLAWVLGILAVGSPPSACAEQEDANATASSSASTPNSDSFYSADWWQTTGGQPATEYWEFTDGELHLQKPQGGKATLVSPPLPPHFELSWQWKIEDGCNTGLKYRVRRFGKSMFSNSYLGIEYQIIDEPPGSHSKGSTASIYDLQGPSESKTLHPPGQWNQSRVVAVGQQLKHYLNGELVAEVVTQGPEWDLRMAMSKFYGAKDFGRPADGDRIMLTDHGGKAVYKDFQFVVKQADEKAPESALSSTPADGPYLGNGIKNSWADQSSIVIWTRTTESPELLSEGTKFISLSTSKAGKLSKSTDEAEIHRAQIPEGKQLEEMFGACPSQPGRVRLTYFPTKQRKNAVVTEWKTTTSESDCTAQWKLEGLKPGTQYAVIVEARSVDDDVTTAVLRGGFETAPSKTKEQPIKFCITTCHDFIRRDNGMQGHKIYPVMRQMNPDFIVHAGDIEYYDKPDPWAMTKPLMRFKWGRIFALPTNREFYSNTTSYFIKDDHDTLKNDCWVGQRYGTVSFKEGVELFNNEQFPSHPKRYTSVRWGKALEIWILEGRDFRSPNSMKDGPEKSILGAEQKAWLLQSLRESDATFKVICSPTPIVGPDRKNKRDNHANDIFEHEGNEIREALSELENVIVLCGDRHWQYASTDPDTGLWEFGCGPGSEEHQLGWKEGDERPMHRFLRVAGGFLSGRLSYGDGEPTLVLRHHTVTGEEVSRFKFPMAE